MIEIEVPFKFDGVRSQDEIDELFKTTHPMTHTE